jgi:N-acetylgalactosamine-N,N'-diacetylbacillosaminyl-diphospho-undecaprenol 4-alpha-N-acetylgalactosaminyltransferase
MFILPSLGMGGAEKVVTVLLKELLKYGYEIHLCCLEKDVFYKIDDRVKMHYLTNSLKKENNIVKLLKLPILSYKLYKIIKKEGINIVQSHLFRANIVNTMLKLFDKSLNVQLVNHGLISRYTKMGIKGKINLFLIKYFYKKADIIVSLSKYMQYDMQKLFNFTNKQIIINNPYDINNIINQSLENINEFNFDKNKKYLISIGRLIKLKRNKDLILALKDLSEDFEVIFLGDGEEKENLINLSKELDITHRVHLLGNVQNPFKYLKHSFASILTSQNEGFPNVLIESMICKIPIVSTDCKSGPREILAPNTDFMVSIKNNMEITEYGILIPVNDIKYLIKAIKYIDTNNQNDIINNSFNRSKLFSVENIAQEYKLILENKNE